MDFSILLQLPNRG